MVCLEFEPGPQDGRRSLNHGAMTATLELHCLRNLVRYNFWHWTSFVDFFLRFLSSLHSQSNSRKLSLSLRNIFCFFCNYFMTQRQKIRSIFRSKTNPHSLGHVGRKPENTRSWLNTKEISEQGQWLWHVWQSGRLPHHRIRVRIQSWSSFT